MICFLGSSNLLKKALALKNDLQVLVDKYNKLEIRKKDNDEEVSTDSEMEEVAETIPEKKPCEEEFSFLIQGSNVILQLWNITNIMRIAFISLNDEN